MKRLAAEIGESAVGEKARVKLLNPEMMAETCHMKCSMMVFASCDEITTRELNLRTRLHTTNPALYTSPQNPVPVLRRYCSGSKLRSQIRNRMLTVGLFVPTVNFL
jgi:hypothetical protein